MGEGAPTKAVLLDNLIILKLGIDLDYTHSALYQILYSLSAGTAERLTHNCSTSSMVTLLTSSLGLTEKVGVAKARVPTFSGCFGQHTNVDPPKAMYFSLI